MKREEKWKKAHSASLPLLCASSPLFSRARSYHSSRPSSAKLSIRPFEFRVHTPYAIWQLYNIQQHLLLDFLTFTLYFFVYVSSSQRPASYFFAPLQLPESYLCGSTSISTFDWLVTLSEMEDEERKKSTRLRSENVQTLQSKKA